MRLTAQERLLLAQVVVAGGSYIIEGLTEREMLAKATTALRLKNHGLVWSKIEFSKVVPGQPLRVAVQLTERGRQVLDAEIE